MNFWDQRYNQKEYVYGTSPNLFFQSKLGNLPVGKALFAAEGEGRNAVYAAGKGWDVDAFDTSRVGKEKAYALAELNHLTINYQVVSFEDVEFEKDSFDLIVFIFVHLPNEVRKVYFQKAVNWLKPGGKLILEGFSKNHIMKQSLNPQVGGPRDIEMLYDLDELKSDFINFDWQEAYEAEVDLSEGDFHVGLSSVIRLFGTKKPA